jgi:rhodanese-related sulfurtransferase
LNTLRHATAVLKIKESPCAADEVIVENVLLALMILCAAPGAIRAEDAPLRYIATVELAARLDAPRAPKSNLTVIDARSRVEYGEAHIPAAINIPAEKVAALLPRFVKDRSGELVFYCNGPKCTKSQKAARTAIALGYANVLEYNEGMPGWGKGRMPIAGSPLPPVDLPAIAPEDLVAMLKKRGQHPLLLDLRDAQEFRSYHLKGAVNIPLDDLAKRVRYLPKDREIVLACHAGQQSIVGARLLHHLGINRMRRLDGGIVAWQQKGLPLESAAVAAIR